MDEKEVFDLPRSCLPMVFMPVMGYRKSRKPD